MSEKKDRRSWEPTDEILDEIEKYASRQLSLEQIAACIGIHRNTLRAKCAEYPEIEDRIQQGKAKGISVLVNKLYEKANNGSEKALMFFLKCKDGWREDSFEGLTTIPIKLTVEGKNIEIG